MERQVWIFLNDDDEAALLERLDGGAGVRRLAGRFLRGSIEDVRTHPESIETAELKSTEKWTHLLHPAATARLVLHPVTDGPFAGWTRLDEVTSEVVTLVRPLADSAGLAPARLRAHTHAWFGAEKLRKSPAFTQWATELLRVVESYPPTAFDWIRVAPGAAAWARSGGVLHYLFRPVPLEPEPGGTAVHRPHASKRD